MKITEGCFEATGHTSIICDFSPPRSGNPEVVEHAQIDADFVSVAYNPGRAVRTSSAMLAAAIQRSGKNAVFTLATRDMNKLALQSQLLGAQMLGLQNVVVVQGDPFGQKDHRHQHQRVAPHSLDRLLLTRSHLSLTFGGLSESVDCTGKPLL